MNFAPLDAALQQALDREELAGVSYNVLRHGAVVASGCFGWADREAGTALRPDHLFRIFSHTKLLTSIAVLQMVEQGRIGLDDPVGEYLPALRALSVLRNRSGPVDDVVPLAQPMLVRHLLTHTAGFTYSFMEPESPIGQAYTAAGVSHPKLTLAQMVDALGQLPLLFQPGRDWNYSVATDVAGRLLEVVQGEPFDACLRRAVLEPLGLRDTCFFVPPEQAHRLATLYVGDLNDPGRPGLSRADHLPWPGAFLAPVPRLNAGGGLVSSLADSTRVLQVLLEGGAPLLKPASMAWVAQNQLPAGQWIGAQWGDPPGIGHSFACGVMVEPAHAFARAGELHWSGLAGTHWWASPREGVAVVLMTQRFMGAGLEFWWRFRAALRGVLDR